MRHTTRHLFLIACAASTLLACSATSEDEMVDESAEDLTKTCGKGPTVPGLDVARYQQHIDFAQVKASGREWVIAATNDGTVEDPNFVPYFRNAKAAGLIVGAYFFYRAATEHERPGVQVDILMRKLNEAGYDPKTDLPPAVDIEGATFSRPVSSSTAVADLHRVLDAIETKIGRKPIIYTNSTWDEKLGSRAFGEYPLWAAQYRNDGSAAGNCPLVAATGAKTWTFWQHCAGELAAGGCHGGVPGVTTNPDRDVFNGTLEELKAFARGGNGGAPPPPDSKPAPEPAPAGESCGALTYPSGVTIQTFPDAALTAVYEKHLAAGQVAPTCFLDTNKLVNPKTGEVYSLDTNLSTDFKLKELVGTEVPTWGHSVLVPPAAVEALQKFRDGVAISVELVSGYRSPRHQEDTCARMCGNPLGCTSGGAVTCSNHSRHMWGDAYDLPLAFYTARDQQLACDSGFKFAYRELGTHLHIDQNPALATCLKQ